MYIEEMDSIFHDNPSVNSDNIVSVGVETNPIPASTSLVDNVSDSVNLVDIVSENVNLDESNDLSNASTPSSKSTKKSSLLQIKRQYYEDKIKEKKKTREMLEKYLKEKELAKEKRHQELIKALTKSNK